MTDMTKKMSKTWNNLNEDEKKVYEDLSKKDKERYERQKE